MKPVMDSALNVTINFYKNSFNKGKSSGVNML